jgi:hypothetical protein
MRAFIAISVSALAASACEFAGSGDAIATAPPITCPDGTADPLQANGAGDEYDCFVLASVTAQGHPDAMLIKAQMAQESGFDPGAISPDSPCGIHPGWTDAQSKSFGLTQVTPACNEASSLIVNGVPDLVVDPNSADWPHSAFNPKANIDEGVRTCLGFLARMKADFPGCTDAEYALMSAGAFNSGEHSVLGCNMFNDRAQGYVAAVINKYQSLAARAGWPNPY